ncbi:MAG: SAM-dependent methyltransferase [Phycisphaeraceae bacterium]
MTRQAKAKQADKYALYQQAVQDPETEIAFLERAYRSHFGRTPRVLREDFCGAFAVCCEWAKKRGRSAVGVDVDPEPLAWGREHNLAKLDAEARKRVRTLEQDVREVRGPRADVVAAANFSFWIFEQRAELLRYFKAARRNLAREGVLVLDMMGGSESYVEEQEEVRRCRGFRYVWEQVRFDPVSSTGRWHIHFRFPDGSELTRAFSYDWRLWTIPEVRELLEEAGFDESHVYWEGTDPETGEGDGQWRKVRSAASDPAWIAYVVAVKRG